MNKQFIKGKFYKGKISDQKYVTLDIPLDSETYNMYWRGREIKTTIYEKNISDEIPES